MTTTTTTTSSPTETTRDHGRLQQRSLVAIDNVLRTNAPHWSVATATTNDAVVMYDIVMAIEIVCDVATTFGMLVALVAAYGVRPSALAHANVSPSFDAGWFLLMLVLFVLLHCVPQAWLILPGRCMRRRDWVVTVDRGQRFAQQLQVRAVFAAVTATVLVMMAIVVASHMAVVKDRAQRVGETRHTIRSLSTIFAAAVIVAIASSVRVALALGWFALVVVVR